MERICSNCIHFDLCESEFSFSNAKPDDQACEDFVEDEKKFQDKVTQEFTGEWVYERCQQSGSMNRNIRLVFPVIPSRFDTPHYRSILSLEIIDHTGFAYVSMFMDEEEVHRSAPMDLMNARGSWVDFRPLTSRKRVSKVCRFPVSVMSEMR